MTRVKFLLFFITLLISVLGIACSSTIQFPFNLPSTQPSTPPSTSTNITSGAKYLVLVSIDACRPDYFDIAEIPNIKKLMADGTSYSNAWVGQLRNDTPPGHTVIATGSFAKNNGILGFTWKDSATQKQIKPTDWEPVVAGEMTRLIVESGCTSIGSLFKKAHPEAKVAAISSDKFYAATGLGSNSADYILFNAAQHMKDYATKGGLNLIPGGVAGHLAPDDIMNDPDLKGKKVNNYDGDTWAIDLAIKLINKEKPQIMLINLPQTDHSGHATGGINDPKEMSAVVGNADKQIGRLIDTYKQAGIYDQTIFVITSDHAMTPEVSALPAAGIRKLLTQAGIPITQGGREIYLNNPARSEQAAETIARSKLPEINGVYYKKKSTDGSYAYFPASTTANNGNMDLNKCYQYLTSTYASEKSCDVFIATADEDWGKAASISGGNHGAATWTNQHVPMILSGPGIKKGFVSQSPARLVDIAPTVLTLMGIEPQKMDGLPLADAFIQSYPSLITAQQTLNTELTPLQKALKSRSEQETGTGLPNRNEK